MKLRANNIAKLSTRTFDVLVVGGGINGAVAASALAARGVSVALVDRGDFAGGTSQHSSNLAWGGIKYLESREFGLVRALCKSRNHLLANYPSTVREARFFAVIQRGFRWSPLFLWLGTWVYWLIGGGFTRAPTRRPKRAIEREEPVVETRDVVGGFEYSDAYFHDNDARFVFNFIRAALSRGCIAANYLDVKSAKRVAKGGDFVWKTRAVDRLTGASVTVRSRVVINAAGPWVDALNDAVGQTTAHTHVFSKGIHLIVPRITRSGRVLTFFADDGRLFFAIPMGNRTCIGTTDTRVEHPEPVVTDADRKFVLDNINKRLRLKRPLVAGDVIAERCGVRPLVVQRAKASPKAGTDFMQLSRKHAVEVDAATRYVSIFGGKLTDCINVGEEVCDEIAALGVEIPHPKFKWYGEPPAEVYAEFLHQAKLMDLDGYTAPESSEPLSRRLWRRYGAQAIGLLENIREDPSEAEVLIKGTEYLRCELRQAARREMVAKLEDFLRRRSKIALVEKREVILASPGLVDACRILFGDEAQAKLDEYVARG